MAWAIDDARWVLGNPRYLDLLVIAAVGGVLVGFIGPKVGWGRWLTFLIGAIFAALLVPLLVGLVDFPGGASIGELYRTTATARSRPTSTSPSSTSRRRGIHAVRRPTALSWGRVMPRRTAYDANIEVAHTTRPRIEDVVQVLRRRRARPRMAMST